MKVKFDSFSTVKEALDVVNKLMSDGISAYRQGLVVFVDDGGLDDAI